MARNIRSVLEFAELYKNQTASAEPDWQNVSRIFDVCMSTGKMKVPSSFSDKVDQWFGCSTGLSGSQPNDTVKRMEEQRIVRIWNKWTCEQTLFNSARAKRPVNVMVDGNTQSKETGTDGDITVENCDFCEPYKLTAEDPWGRLERKTCLTASNVAKYDGCHGMIIFKKHSPTKYSEEKLLDMFSIAEEWFLKANHVNRNAVYPMLGWNCLSRAGASQHHGHCHLLLGEGFHYSRWEQYRQCAANYTRVHAGRNYFHDLISAHRTLGLAKQCNSAHILLTLTPYLRFNFEVLSWNYEDFKQAMHEALTELRFTLQSKAFNVNIQFPALKVGESPDRVPSNGTRSEFGLFTNISESETGMFEMPYIGSLVDRGDPDHKASDICATKLFGSSISSTDPFELSQIVFSNNFSQN